MICSRAAACGDRERVLNELRASAGRRLRPAQFFELHFVGACELNALCRRRKTGVYLNLLGRRPALNLMIHTPFDVSP